MNAELLNIEDPQDYFSGIGQNPLPIPTNVLMFVRKTKDSLQQEALQNRSHHRFVLALNLETEGCIHVDHLTLPFIPKQALLILPYQFHHFTHLSSNRLAWLFCTFELQSPNFLEPLRNRVIDISGQTQQLYTDLLNQWHDVQGELQEEQLQTVLLHLLLSLKQDRVQASHDLPLEPADNLLRTVNRLLSEHSGKPIVSADLAEAMHYSESRLRALFKDAAGIPLGAYIQNYRINRAMALLKTTELSIADVAEEAGFGSPQAFSRIFKQASGRTPRDYRSQ